jgi:methylated-DNA-protein-cysteine methyltransferase-like protein
MAARGRKTLTALLLPLSRQAGPRRTPGADSPALEAIWHTVCAIPPGRVSTYGAVARAAGLPGRARLTGFALKVAPKEMDIPWHRVVGAGGRISFPAASAAHREQARRLRAEGVAVKNGRVAPAALTGLEER